MLGNWMVFPWLQIFGELPTTSCSRTRCSSWRWGLVDVKVHLCICINVYLLCVFVSPPLCIVPILGIFSFFVCFFCVCFHHSKRSNTIPPDLVSAFLTGQQLDYLQRQKTWQAFALTISGDRWLTISKRFYWAFPLQKIESVKGVVNFETQP